MESVMEFVNGVMDHDGVVRTFLRNWETELGAVGAILGIIGMIYGFWRWLRGRRRSITIDDAFTAALIKEYQQREKELEAQLQAARAKGAEAAGAIDTLQAELAAVRTKEENPEQAAQDRRNLLQSLADVFRRDGADMQARADAALKAGDVDKANALLAEIAAEAARDRAKADDTAGQAAQREARALMAQGRIAADQVRWHDAARFYARAADLDPRYETLIAAGDYADRIGDYPAAQPLAERAVTAARTEFGPDSPEHATALNNLALLLHARGNLDGAEPLYRQAGAIWKAALGADHPDYAISLWSLGMLKDAQGKPSQAEPLVAQAVKILEAKTPDHPNTARARQHLTDIRAKLAARD